MAKDALGAHARDELGISEIDVARPLQAALASAAAFAVGGLIPLAAVLAAGVQAVVIAVLVALGGTGALAAGAGGAPRARAAVRVLVGGSLAMAISAVIGGFVGAAL